MKEFFPIAIALLLIAAAIVYLESIRPAAKEQAGAEVAMDLMGNEEKTRIYPAAKELVAPAGFINAEKITVGENVGKKVVLIDFWTYSCINCQRTIPYLNAWHEKYAGKGLQIIGVHTPEFEFEKDYANVQAAVEKFGIKYPVALDNDYATWRAYRNRYWPRKYLVDVDGFIVYDHIGEGAYEETEKKIQELLEERNSRLAVAQQISKEVFSPSVEATQAQSPEVYFGASRNELLANGEAGKTGEQELVLPEKIEANALYLSGKWNFAPEYAEALEAGASIVFRYRAKKVFLVAEAPQAAPATVLLDGKPLAEKAGADVDKQTGVLRVKEAGLYKLVEGMEFGERTLEIIAQTPGLRAYTFTFG